MITRKNICSISSFLIWTLLALSNSNAQDIGLPKYISSDQIIIHTAYTLKYNETHEQASWVAYKLISSHTCGPHKRTKDYRTDPAVKTGSASLADYKGSGYDRGHLAPAGDMKWSLKAMSESFFMSNMSPQRPGFNCGIWKRLESNVRNWAKENGEIYIVTGPIITGSYPTIGSNKVSVPPEYYKVILDYREPELKGIGFILPNEKSSQHLSSFAKTIDEVEHRTGIDFYHALPDGIEEPVESTVNVNKWSFSSSSSYSRGSSKKSKAEKLAGHPKININKASKSELMKLPGIGAALSGRIIEYRRTHDLFHSVDELKKVKGIGPKKVEKLRPYVEL